MSIKKEFTKCKVTGEKIPIVFNFGKMPIANNFSKNCDKKNLYKMKIAFNESNGLFQLVEAPKPKKLFNENYAFMSSTSKSMQIHFKEIARKIDKLSKELVPHGQLSRSKVIEIIVNEKLSNFYKSKEI